MLVQPVASVIVMGILYFRACVLSSVAARRFACSKMPRMA